MDFMEELYGKKAQENNSMIICAPVAGQVVPQDQLPDPSFSEGVLGDGCGIEPEDEIIYAPFDGSVTWISDNRSAMSLSSWDGLELLIHIGLDTVKMGGRGFDVRVEQGQEIKLGQPLMDFNLAAIREAGCCDTVVLVVTNTAYIGSPELLEQGKVSVGTPLLQVQRGSFQRRQVNSLRSALSMLRGDANQLIETNTEVDPNAQLSGVYRYVGAGGTVMRPTRSNGPAMLFHNVKGHPDSSVLIGLLASRERVATLLGCKKEELGRLLMDCVANPVPPVVSNLPAPCQEVVHLATDPDFDLFKLIPAPTNTEQDAGPYITMGMCYATHPDTGKSNITIHRMCIQSRDELSIFLQPGSRHIGAMAERATELGQPLPISVSIGVDPAIEVGACFEPPTTPLGYDELAVAGALRQKPVVLHKCLTVEENAISNAEYVIEGEIIPGVRVVEDQNTHTGYAMPEFPGYNGHASNECWLLKVKAVTHRKHPIMQSVIGPSEEHVNLAGIPTEASILTMLERALPGFVKNAYAHPSGGGKYMIILQCCKKVHTDEGKQRQAALLAFAAFSELKHVILVDEDVDIFDTNDVLWALNTRFQGDRDIITIPGVRCHPLDPSANHDYSVLIPDVGVSCKLVFDCTVPFRLKKNFERAKFMEVDYTQWMNG